jgi:hypothetical protein
MSALTDLDLVANVILLCQFPFQPDAAHYSLAADCIFLEHSGDYGLSQAKILSFVEVLGLTEVSLVPSVLFTKIGLTNGAH